MTNRLDQRIIQNFMDVIILKHLKNNHPMSGYDVVKYFHEKFQILPSAGTVYSLLYTLERKNLIEGTSNQTKRVYKLTREGEKLLQEINDTRNYLNTLISSIFS